MQQITANELLKLGKRHKKWNEDVTIELFPYAINNHRYYLAYYLGKFSREIKNIAILSPDSSNKDEALNALKQLVYFTITFDKVENNTKTRAELNFEIYGEIRNYLRNILNSGVLQPEFIDIYDRSYKVVDKTLRLQDEMLELRSRVNKFAQDILDRGYFIDSDIDEVLSLFPAPGWIQYQQFYDSYRYRNDFDVIYKNENNPELIPFFKFRDPKTLFNMTSGIAEEQLKKSLDIVTDKQDMSNFSKEDYFNYWTKKFEKGLSDRYIQLRKIIRNL